MKNTNIKLTPALSQSISTSSGVYQNGQTFENPWQVRKGLKTPEKTLMYYTCASFYIIFHSHTLNTKVTHSLMPLVSSEAWADDLPPPVLSCPWPPVRHGPTTSLLQFSHVLGLQ